uniref:C-type lectin domain-containing protein n=1 Tax=Ciona savignyi TaxID=51511 RepID=H2ZJR9_CIOSA
MGFLPKACSLLVVFIAVVRANNGINDVETRRGSSKEWMSLCPCARAALHDMQQTLANYTNEVQSANPPNLNDVIANIKNIAYNCTKQPGCQCPEGYFKTRDGYNCLKISDQELDCDAATTACSSDMNARLAVAKDHRGLTKLADYIRDYDPTGDEFYWIGLSYNRTNGGIPVWKWEDGSSASYDITRNLRSNVRKNLLRIVDVTDNARQPLERVVISKDYTGNFWKQEMCGVARGRTRVARHKYICEFMMFKVEIKAVTSTSRRSGTARQYVHGAAGSLA